jgi:hypothetical protein
VLIPKEGVGKKERKKHRVNIFMSLAVANVQIEPGPANK